MGYDYLIHVRSLDESSWSRINSDQKRLSFISITNSSVQTFKFSIGSIGNFAYWYIVDFFENVMKVSTKAVLSCTHN